MVADMNRRATSNMLEYFSVMMTASLMHRLLKMRPLMTGPAMLPWPRSSMFRSMIWPVSLWISVMELEMGMVMAPPSSWVPWLLIQDGVTKCDRVSIEPIPDEMNHDMRTMLPVTRDCS